MLHPIPYPPRVDLARLPTPLHPLERVSERTGVEIWVKRDDLTGTLLSGNKIRKLEFLLADAQAKGCDAVITTGGVQSNHARATAVAAVRLGLKPFLLLRGDPTAEVQGNLLLDRLVGAELRFITPAEYAHREELMAAWSLELEGDGLTPYLIPEGGSNEVGIWGYVRALEEIEEQARELETHFDTIVHAAGSGGTSAGLALGKELCGFKGDVLGFAVCDDAAYFREVAGTIIEAAVRGFDLPVAIPRSALRFDDGFVGRGYALTRPEELEHLVDLARTEALILDPVYTNKAFLGMVSTLARDRDALGKRVLFLHTGGIYGLFPQAGDLLPHL